MKYAVAAILLVGLLVGLSLAGSLGNGGAAMVVFAVLAVVFFASLPVVLAKGSRGGGVRTREAGKDGPDREVVDFGRGRENVGEVGDGAERV